MAEDPLTIHARQRVGRVLRSKWTLDRLIGVGGMAAVYEATHRNGSKVAIKMLHPTLMFDTNFAHRLVQEGYVANKINHPAAVRVFDDDTDEVDGTVFLVMELLTGNTLSALRRQRKRFPQLEAFKLMLPVLEALGSAHQKKIIHRDIKPENLFVTRDGLMHVLDFGIARISDGSSVSQTRTGMVVGSPAYMSPEQALGKMNSVGPQTDVYAVGATLFALISGKTPHSGESTQEMIVMVATQPARSLSVVMPDAHPAVVRVVDRALSYEHNNRFPDALAMLEAMRDAICEVEGGKEKIPAVQDSDGLKTNLMPTRALPTFADDDDEGETRVSNALGSGAKPAATPGSLDADADFDESDNDDETSHLKRSNIPAAGSNRVGVRPETGQFKAPAAPLLPTLEPRRLRPPTMAPTGTPSMTAHLGPIVSHPQNPDPVASAGAKPAHPNASGQGAPAQVLPPAQHPPILATMIGGPGFNEPVANVREPGVVSQPGLQNAFPFDPLSSSGPRPGITTGMAWAAPPEAVPSDRPPKKSPVKFIVAAGALVAVLGLGFVAKTALSSDPAVTPEAPTHATHQVTPTPPTNPESRGVIVAPSNPSQVLSPVAHPPVAHPPGNNAHAPIPGDPVIPGPVQQPLASPTPRSPVPPVVNPPVVNPPAANPRTNVPPTRSNPNPGDNPERVRVRGHGHGRHTNPNSNGLGY